MAKDIKLTNDPCTRELGYCFVDLFVLFGLSVRGWWHLVWFPQLHGSWLLTKLTPALGLGKGTSLAQVKQFVGPVSFEPASCLTPLVLQVRSAHRRNAAVNNYPAKKHVPLALINMESFLNTFCKVKLVLIRLTRSSTVFPALHSAAGTRLYMYTVHFIGILIMNIYLYNVFYLWNSILLSVELCWIVYFAWGCSKLSKTSLSPRFRKPFKPFRAQPE